MNKVILAAVAISLPLFAFNTPVVANVMPNHVWSELGADVRPSVRATEPGGYLSVLNAQQTAQLDNRCSGVIRNGGSAATIEFCHLLKDEIDTAEADDRDGSG